MGWKNIDLVDAKVKPFVQALPNGVVLSHETSYKLLILIFARRLASVTAEILVIDIQGHDEQMLKEKLTCET